MRTSILCGLILGGALFAAKDAIPHHSFAAEFDADQPIELTGIVTLVEWTNPHVWFYINVRDPETGQTVNWGAEMGPPHGLQRRGWRRDSLSIGDEVTVNGWLARNGSNRLNARNVQLTATGGEPGQTLDADSSRGVTP